MKKYDLIVIGSGPAGEKAAVKAAYFGHKVAIVEKRDNLGGGGIYTGTIPSKALKETALHLSGKYESTLYGVDSKSNKDARMEDFLFRKQVLSTSLGQEVKVNLEQHNVEVFHGEAVFENAHTIQVTKDEQVTELCADNILIATGSYPFHPENFNFDGKYVHDSNSILEIEKFPESICIVGAGVIGVEFATIFSTIGSKVHLVNDQKNILPFLDSEVTQHLIDQMQKNEVETYFEDAVDVLEVKADQVQVKLKSGKNLQVNLFLFAAGRCGNTKSLNCEQVGVVLGERETVEVNEEYATSIPHIYAAGDVIGFPSLASTSTDQGRVAVAHMFHTQDLEYIASVFPYGMYTIPEISKVGLNEAEAQEKGVEYSVGRAHYPDMARGKVMGSECGFLKVLFEKVSLKVLGVHIIGPIATEIVHYGLSLVEEQKTLSHIIGQVFNYPTLHDLYKYAAYDGLGNLSGHNIKCPETDLRK